MLKISIALVGLMLSLSTNAAIIDLGNITRDTATGLDWLDVTQTLDLSHDQVTAQMGIGGAYEGWRYATMAELDQVITDFGYTAVTSGCWATSLHCDDTNIGGQIAIIDTMIRTLGDTGKAYLENTHSGLTASPAAAGFTRGLLGSQNANLGNYDNALIFDGNYVYQSNGFPAGDYQDRVITAYASTPSSYHSSEMGSFLVATTPSVPIPAAAWLFGSGLISLTGLSRKRKTA